MTRKNKRDINIGLKKNVTPHSTNTVVLESQELNSEKVAVEMKKAQKLAKNRMAAKVCREKKKEYVKCLEERVKLLEDQNALLLQELRKLKSLLGTDEK
ncbi:cyclic AMP-dependent transcription factor ATF-1-like [Zophobas morio]|uniref:cyclic AMP-dependent transcription factor ATF-1-like n=1 Tax=Zophobas morio TaxID=2755281 RepID=UPI0030833A1F